MQKRILKLLSSLQLVACNWRPVTSSIPQGKCWVQSCPLMIWVMGQSALSPSFLITPSMEERLVYQGVTLSSRGPWQAGETCCQEPPKVQQGQGLSCIWGGTTLGTNTCWGYTAAKQLIRKGAGGPGGTKLNTSQHCAPVTKEVNSALRCIRKSAASIVKSGIPFTQHQWGLTWSAVSSSGHKDD